MPGKEFVSPIAIDLGAKNTGVYFAHYPKGISSLNDENFKKSGKVYRLEKDSYSLLMANRTAKRHQKRGYDRRQMAKRLLKLIWEKHFDLTWDKYVQQSLSFLLNRRGFTFLTEDYDSERLGQFPKPAYELLPKELKEGLSINTDNEVVNLDSALKEWATNPKKIKECYQALKTKIYLEELKQACDLLETGNYKTRKNKLSEIDKEIWENMKKQGVKGLDDLSGTYSYKNKKGETKEWSFIYGNKVNILAYLQHNQKKRQELKISLSNLIESKEKKQDNSSQTNINPKDLKLIWNFNPEDFKLDKVLEEGSFDLSDDLGGSNQIDNGFLKKNSRKSTKSTTRYLKTHLHHLAFALYKTHNELESGGRHRSKYFEEVQNVLACKNHNHNYLKEFCNKLHSGNFKIKGTSDKLTSKNLTSLIGHISNFELKPLRKYFNDKKHQIGDYWDEAILAEKFENWFKTEWRVNIEKDKEKAPNKQGDYKKLKEKWKEHLNLSESLKSKPRAKRWEELKKEWTKKHRGKLINFWLNTDPFCTIPPYQDNNNRRPPKCQSLILNPEYLNTHYKDWEKWLEDLKPLVEDYLDDYEIQLKKLKSSSEKKIVQTENINTYSYFNEKESKNANKKASYRRSQQYLKARVLQFIFDRVKNTDSLKLNKIYSRTKKYRQTYSENQNPALTTNSNNNQMSIKEDIERAIQKSKLPDHLKTKRNYKEQALFDEGTFLHLVCKYYKLRQKARDGRIFIQPKYHYVKDQGYKNTGRFDDKNSLLTYCNYKPRQKRYQMSEDLASLLQIPSKKLKEYANNFFKNTDQIDQNLFDWLKSIKDLKINCDKATKEQKNRRGGLKLDIQNVYKFITYKEKNNPLSENENKRNKQIKEFLKQSQIKNNNFLFVDADKNKKIESDFKLYKLCKKSKELCLKITNNGLYNESKQKQWEKDLEKNPASAFYFLSQINNIVFKERKGNAKTCPVCSVDNAQRMQNYSLKEGEIYKEGEKAQRLPAIPTRLIDGAVMRMARIVGNAIAEEKWETIKPGLEKGLKICIPIITESNQFEFEPSREVLVKQQRIGRREGKVLKRGGDIKIFEQKTDRIKTANPKKICPYKGIVIYGEGHIDHILPRSGKRGILNDEANLIWASEEGNQHKNNKNLSLSDLKTEYKNSVFNGKTDKEIQEWITNTIGNGEEEFKFGKYHNFINLSSDEQKAFRHALFLVGHTLRDKVIQAIDNRTRALVNGTQRYFAEILANKLYKKILYHNQKNKSKPIKINDLSFDYFGVSSNGDPDSVPFVRRYLENKKDKSGKFIHPEILENKKINNLEKDKDEKIQSTQTDYSHLIDAKVAFMIALSQHCKEGSLKVNTEIDPYSDKLYPQIRVEEKDFEIKLLERRLPAPKDITASHRPLFNENAVAMHFLKLIEIESNEIKDYLVGFLDIKRLKKCLKYLKKEDWKGCIGISKNQNKNKRTDVLEEYKYQYANSLKESKGEKLKNLYNEFSCKKSGWPKIIIDREELGSHQWTVKLYQIDKQKIYEFLIKNFNTKIDSEEWTETNYNIFKQLQELWYFTQKKNVMNDKNKFKKPKDDNFKCAGLINPHLKNSWENLKNQINPGNDILPQIKKYFLHKKKKTENRKKLDHQKTRKIFSLPIKTQKGFLIKKKNWQNQNVFYFRPASNDFSQTILHRSKERELLKSEDKRLSNIYRKNNIVYIDDSVNKLKKLMKPISSDSNLVIDPNKYYPAKILEEDLKDYIKSIKNKRTDENRPKFRFELTSKKMTFEIFKKFIKKYPFRKLQDLKKEYRENGVYKLQNKKQLMQKIKKLRKIKLKPTDLLQTLEEMNKLWEESQTKNILEYQAKSEFTVLNLINKDK